jgi:general L-amino acid transport system permease protein
MSVRATGAGAPGRRWRLWALQLGLVLLLGAGVWAMFDHAFAVLRQRGIQAGFDFLLEPAGFRLGESWLAFEPGQPFWRAFAAGLANTARVVLPALLLATGLGLLIGIGRLAPHALLRGLCTAYVEALRNVPLLVQLLMWYFALTELLPSAAEAWQLPGGVYLSKSGLSLPWPVESANGTLALEWPEPGPFNIAGGAAVTPEFLAVLLALASYTAAFIAETVRAGIQAVPVGQVEAARALGLQPLQQLRFVVLPQALRVIVPSLTNQYLNLTKNSTLAVAVGYPELVSVSNTALNQTGRAFECIAVLMAVYLTLSLLTAALMNRYNARVALRGTP